MTEEQFDAFVNGDNGLSAHIDPMTEEQFDAFVNGDNGLDMPKGTKETLDWIDNTKRVSSSAAAATPPVEGIWTNFKNALFAAYLVPASDASLRGRIASKVLSPGMMNDLRPDAGHTDRLVVETLGGYRRYDNNTNPVRLVVGAPGAHVYPLSQGSTPVTRNDFFRSGRGALESGGAKVTFTNPATNEPETWKLTFDPAQARTLHQSTAWATKGSELMLVLRFANEGENPALREVVVLNSSSSSSALAAAAALPKLNKAEEALAELVVKGQAFATAGVGHDALGADAENAHRVLGRALAALSSAYAGTIADLGALPADAPAPSSKALPTLKAFAVACHEQDMGDQDDEAGVAARRGDALAARIQGALTRTPTKGVVAAVHALASAAKVAHMCYFRSHAAAAEHRLAQFLAAKPEHRADKVSLHAMFFG
jgi:hypothetical protein